MIDAKMKEYIVDILVIVVATLLANYVARAIGDR